MALYKLIPGLALAGLARGQVDNTRASGNNPINENSRSHRKTGFTGHLQGKWHALYGDPLWWAAGVDDPTRDTDSFYGMVRDSVSALTDDPLVVHDLNPNSDDLVAHQNSFVPH
ncbi:hypothetical protein BKA56DRAFT_611343 [Ilyonectria sp. MPI-CAGE-AT-0026]|nr:hypothetical protein BKA56DRAFT_611343 [Ilyonectria sp. MPI-CAGE-AT-0026]